MGRKSRCAPESRKQISQNPVPSTQPPELRTQNLETRTENPSPMNPLVSIITVVFNGAKTLEQTIQSVLGQTYKNIEYIIVDGGSTDGTLDIIQKYEDRIARWVSEPDRGLYDAMNKGIRMATGEIIGIINSDDWYELNAVESIMDAYRKHPEKKVFHGDRYDVSVTGARRIRKFNPSTFKFLYYAMTYNHPTMFVNRNVYKETVFNTSLRALSDYQFVLTNFLKNKDLFYYIPQAYVNYRLDGVSGQMRLPSLIREGYVSRKNAGMSWPGLVLSTTLRVAVFFIFKVTSLMRKDRCG
jgi:glycosyltransferase involved in cell wall biosynthesis